MKSSQHNEVSDAADHIGQETQARALRLMRARKMTNLSRREIEEKYQLKASSLKSWEMGRYNGLTEKGAKQIILILNAEHIHCSLEWLLHGCGQGPRLIENQQAVAVLSPHSSADTTPQELALLLQLHPQAVHLYIPDDAMAPQFKRGALVIGLPQPIPALLGRTCIVETEDKQRMVRIIQAGDSADHYHVLHNAHNPTTGDRYNCQLHGVAAIIWQRYTL